MFAHKGVSFYGGGASRAAEIIPGGVYIDLGSHLGSPAQINAREGRFARLREALVFDEIRIPWPDGGIPAWKRVHWETLLQELEEIAPVDVLMACQGGHGRTGTALAILASLAGVVPQGACTVTWLRSHYCESAVETESQEEYIEKMTGRRVKTVRPPGTGKGV